MTTEQTFPTLRGIVIDSTNARAAAEFYRQLLGFTYRAGSEMPPEGADDPGGRDWLVLDNPVGGPHLALQQVESLPPSTWPGTERPQQLHLDLFLPDPDALGAQHARALGLGARLLQDRFDDPTEPLYVYADLDGHPFCMFSPPA
jgi:catechol 2,3-dioxygenase-like lactoylglutathione lyase family enzyme